MHILPNTRTFPIESNNIELLKWFAFFCMILDHVGYILLGENYPLRFIGRIAYPLFGIILAHNFYFFSTSSPLKMIGKLFIFGVLAQLAAIWAMPSAYTGTLNILFSLMGATFLIWGNIEENIQYKFFLYPIGFLISIVSDYCIGGSLMVLFFYLFFKKKDIKFLLAGIFFLFLSEVNVFPLWVVLPALASPFLIYIPELKFRIPRSSKYSFYIGYIVQFLLIGLFLR